MLKNELKLILRRVSDFFTAHLFIRGHATMSVTVGNRTMIDNFPIRGNAFFIIFKNSAKFEYWAFVSAIYAKESSTLPLQFLFEENMYATRQRPSRGLKCTSRIFA